MKYMQALVIIAGTLLSTTAKAEDMKDWYAFAPQHDAGPSLLAMEDWSPEERKWFVRMGPLVTATNPARWTKREQSSLIRLMHAKGADNEREFIRRFGQQERWFDELRQACRRAVAES